MKQKTWVVQPDDRHGGDVACFYCKALVGTEHNMGCVVRTRTVVIAVTIELIREIPEDWEPSMVDFHLNESSWCASNIVSDLQQLVEDKKESGGGRCLCSQFSGSFVREATAEDEVALGHTIITRP